MATTQAGGAYEVGGKIVDANNKPTELKAKPEENADANTSTGTNGNDTDQQPLPKISELEAHLKTLTTVSAVNELQVRDERKTAAAMYEARIEELESAE